MAFRSKKGRSFRRRSVKRTKRSSKRTKRTFARKPKSSRRKSLNPKANRTTLVESQEQSALSWNTLYNFAMTPDVGTGVGVVIPWGNPTPGASINMSSAFPRFKSMCLNYEYFRVTAVEYTYSPEANTYQAGAATAETVPRMWSFMDRTGLFASTSLADLIDVGIKPKAFTGQRKIKYTPNMVATVQVGGVAMTTDAASITLYRKNNWMATSGVSTASGLPIIPFVGHQCYFEATSTASGQLGPKWTVTIHAEFKVPSGV